MIVKPIVVIFGTEIPEFAYYFFGFFLIITVIMLIGMGLRNRSRKKRNREAVRSGADLKEAIKYGVDLEEQKKKDTKNLLVCPRCGIYGNSSNICPECGLKM